MNWCPRKCHCEVWMSGGTEMEQSWKSRSPDRSSSSCEEKDGCPRELLWCCRSGFGVNTGVPNRGEEAGSRGATMTLYRAEEAESR
jgi:hypothetical protein